MVREDFLQGGGNAAFLSPVTRTSTSTRGLAGATTGLLAHSCRAVASTWQSKYIIKVSMVEMTVRKSPSVNVVQFNHGWPQVQEVAHQQGLPSPRFHQVLRTYCIRVHLDPGCGTRPYVECHQEAYLTWGQDVSGQKDYWPLSSPKLNLVDNCIWARAACIKHPRSISNPKASVQADSANMSEDDVHDGSNAFRHPVIAAVEVEGTLLTTVVKEKGPSCTHTYIVKTFSTTTGSTGTFGENVDDRWQGFWRHTSPYWINKYR